MKMAAGFTQGLQERDGSWPSESHVIGLEKKGAEPVVDPEGHGDIVKANGVKATPSPLLKRAWASSLAL
ncbi:MAG: hypothetical protein ACPL68_05260 [Candidatus Hydrothermia bacterium]